MQATLLLVQEAGIKPIYHLHYNYILFPGYKLDGPLKENTFILARKYLRSDSSNKTLYLPHWFKCHAVLLQGSCTVCQHTNYNF